MWDHLQAFQQHRLENLGLHGGAAEMGLGDSEESEIDFLEGGLQFFLWKLVCGSPGH